MLSHERLDVYQRAVEFLDLAVEATESVPAGYGDLRRQLRRASAAIPLNIAEAVGKSGDADQKKYFDIARGSAHECAAIFDVLHSLDSIDRQTQDRAKELLEAVVQMLSKIRNA